MKKFLASLFALLLIFSLVACSGGKDDPPPLSGSVSESTQSESADSGPVAEEVKGVTIPAFSIHVNGIQVTQDSVAEYPMYSVQAKSVNSSGTESTVTYVGFAVSDILKAAGLDEKYVWMEAAASDGYTVTLTGAVIYEDTTLLAMTRDGSPFSDSPWLAPCSDKVTGSYLKGAVSILVNTTEGPPDVKNPAAGSSAGAGEGLPEILDRTEKVEFAPYSFLVNGKEVTNDALAGLRIYKITAVTVNKSGDLVEAGYTGYKLADVLDACGIKGYSVVKAIANDGYETELSGELITSDHTLVAIEKDQELGEDGTIWLAPCSESAANVYCKLVVEIIAE